jgi:hypothetical protein
MLESNIMPPARQKGESHGPTISYNSKRARPQIEA